MRVRTGPFWVIRRNVLLQALKGETHEILTNKTNYCLLRLRQDINRLAIRFQNMIV